MTPMVESTEELSQLGPVLLAKCGCGRYCRVVDFAGPRIYCVSCGRSRRVNVKDCKKMSKADAKEALSFIHGRRGKNKSEAKSE